MEFGDFSPNLGKPMSSEERTERMTMKLAYVKGLIHAMSEAFDGLTSNEQLSAGNIMAFSVLCARSTELLREALKDLGGTVATDILAKNMLDVFTHISGKLSEDDEVAKDIPDEDDGEEGELPEQFQRLMDDLEDMFGDDGKGDTI